MQRGYKTILGITVGIQFVMFLVLWYLYNEARCFLVAPLVFLPDSILFGEGGSPYIKVIEYGCAILATGGFIALFVLAWWRKSEKLAFLYFRLTLVWGIMHAILYYRVMEYFKHFRF